MTSAISSYVMRQMPSRTGECAVLQISAGLLASHSSMKSSLAIRRSRSSAEAIECRQHIARVGIDGVGHHVAGLRVAVQSAWS